MSFRVPTIIVFPFTTDWTPNPGIALNSSGDDNLIPFYNFLKNEPGKTYTGSYKNIPVVVTANDKYEDEDLGDLIVRFTEPDSWD